MPYLTACPEYGTE